MPTRRAADLCATGRAIVALGLVVTALAIALPSRDARAQPATPASTLSPARAPAPAQTLSHGLFTDVQLLRPAGAAQQFVLLLAAGATPGAAERATAESMRRMGAMVAIVPLAPFYRRLAAQDGQCTYAGGAFENLSRHLQAYAQVPGYLLPMLVGAGTSAAFAYAVLAQAPAGTFASALSAGFCPRLALKPPPCATNALRWAAGATADAVELLPATALPAPWAALPGGANAACTPAQAQAFVQRVPQAQWAGVEPRPAPAATNTASASTAAPIAAAASNTTAAFDAAYARLAVRQAAPPLPPAQLADLPLIEHPVPAAGARFVVLLSGDGGWASIDKGLAAAIVAQGVPVVGLDSLRYFWRARTPDGLAADLDRVIRHYAARWKRPEVILIGYSQGADVLPFALNRLPAATRASVRLTALLGLGEKASFEFHLANWIGPSGDRPIAPEARKLGAADTLCIYGQDERDSLCPQLAPTHVRPLALAGGHHFGGDYGAIAVKILDAVPR